MTMPDHIDRAAKVIADFNACGYCEGTCGGCRGEAEALAAAGLLVTPEHDRRVILKYLMTSHTPTVRIENPEQVIPFLAKRDAEVAAKALREAAFIFDHTNDYGGSAVISYLTGRADRIERENQKSKEKPMILCLTCGRALIPGGPVCCPKPPSSECCASGRCEVCTPGFEWGWDG